MLEAYLFVDPLCRRCLQSEKVLLKLSKKIGNYFSYQLIPMLNLKILNQTDYDCRLRYNLVLDYKAALFQGQKKGRSFLMMIQDEIITGHHRYNNQMVIMTAENVGLDLDMFRDDRRSKLAKDAFKHDQQLINKMKIKKPASAVVFNYNDYNCGLLFNNINSSNLFSICHLHTNQFYDWNGIPIPKIKIN